MLGAFANAFKTPDLRRKILFVLFIVVIFRIGSVVPAPGVNVQSLDTCLKLAQGGANANLYNLINLFSGGALLQLAIFALGIMPYITASIILQLLTVVIPRLESLKKEGQAGQAKITQYTRFLTVGLAILQATAFVALARTPGRLFQGCQRAPAAQRQLVPGGRDGADHDRRYRRGDVARRADHRPRRRQRHVDPDLHPDRRHLPVAAVEHPQGEGHAHLHRRARDRSGDHGRGHLHRAGAAPDPGPVRQAHGRPQDVRRHLHLHPAEGEPGRCDPGHLRLQPDLSAGAGQPVPAGRSAGRSGSRAIWSKATTRSTWSRTSP